MLHKCFKKEQHLIHQRILKKVSCFHKNMKISEMFLEQHTLFSEGSCDTED